MDNGGVRCLNREMTIASLLYLGSSGDFGESASVDDLFSAPKKHPVWVATHTLSDLVKDHHSFMYMFYKHLCNSGTPSV